MTEHQESPALNPQADSPGNATGSAPSNASGNATDDSSVDSAASTAAAAPNPPTPAAPAPGRHPFPPVAIGALVRRLRQPLPGAQPRRRFEMPPEEVHAETSPAAETGPGRADAATAGARMPFQHPLYFGFMGTVGVGCALLFFWIGSNITQLLLWIVTALFIALGLDPVVRWLEGRRIPRPAGILVSVGVLAAAVAGFIAILIPTIVEQVKEVVEQAPIWVRDFINSDVFRSADDQFGIRDRINEELEKFVNDPEAMSGIFGGVVGFGSTVANGLFGTLIVLVLSLYFLAAMPSMKRWGYRLAPRSRRARVEVLSEQITRSVGNYVIGQACVALLNATFAFIVMSILGIPFAVLLAFVVALLAFVPLVGGLIAAVVVLLISLTLGWQTTVIYAVCYFAYLQFEAYFISPRIMQKAVAVPGAVAVISVIAGGSLLGILGALIAIPTAAAVLLLVKEVFIVRQDSH